MQLDLNSSKSEKYNFSDQEKEIAGIISLHFWLVKLDQLGVSTRVELMMLARTILKRIEKHGPPTG